MNTETIVISLGGSLIIPDNLDIEFLREFKMLILSQVEKGKKFVIITGGGKVARIYIDGAKDIADISNEDMDWIGISATRLNAELLRSVLGNMAHSKIIINPDLIPETNKPILVGAGWKPGNSSDLAAIHSAVSIGAKKVINLSNIDYVYNKDPNKHPDAEKIEKINWMDFRKLLPEKWEPGISAPFDPVAAKRAEEEGIEVDILNGKNISNLEKCLNKEEFAGTSIGLN